MRPLRDGAEPDEMTHVRPPPSKRGKVRVPPPPKARDPRMDRPATGRPRDPNWLFVMVPTDPAKPVERVQIASGELRRWRLGAVLMASVMITLLIGVAFAWPRSRAYGSLVQENLELKQRLEAIDRKMSEVDRIMLRLRLYDAQLESLGAPLGDNGPIPPETAANAELGELDHDPEGLREPEAMEGEIAFEEGHAEGEEGVVDVWNEEAEGSDSDEGVRQASFWAESIEARAQAFLETFAKTEPNLNLLVEELEQLESLERSLPSLWPSPGYLTSGYGWRRNPFGVRWKHHAGIDVAGKRGDPIHAAADGTVRRAGWLGGYGQAIEIDHGYGVTTLYGHCSELFVQSGDYIRRGERISAMGSTGRSTGPHLHFEVRLDGHAVDPLQYLRVPAAAKRPGRKGRSAPPPGAEIEHGEDE
jgi:murein DD-endopeptidase MepM/ murein hydrolase activator NlpD